MDTRFLINRDRSRANEDRQLPRRLATQKVHLEEALLGMQYAQGERDIVVTVADDGRHAMIVSFNAHGVLQGAHLECPVYHRQAGVEHRADVPEAAKGGYDDEGQEGQGDA